MVQSVVVAKRDCCDRKVRYEVRKPREGEKGFVQCRCEEKRQGATKAVAAPRNDALPPTSTTVELPSLPLLAWSVPAYLSCAIEWAISPAFRPPTYA